ncbi:MAG TPA: hypothetical protein VFB63_00730, partial [Bryobacteraceae bacterium]|nr:hypothetical protein [Bryobacteraceae bacterium]
AAGLGAAAVFAPAELATGGLGVIPSLALGAGVGRGARDLIAEATGLDEPSSALGKAARIALDVGETAAAQAVIPGLAEAVKTPLRTTGDVLKTFPQILPRALRPSLPAGLRLPPRPAGPILARPPWQIGEAAEAAETAITKVKIDPEVFGREFKQLAKKPKLTAEEMVIGARELQAGKSAEQVWDMLLKRRELPASFRALPTDAEMLESLVKRKATGKWPQP